MKQGFKHILAKMSQQQAAEYINGLIAHTASDHPLADYIRSELAKACEELREEAAE